MDVACLHVPNFLVALARRDDPSLRGRPVVIGGSPEEHARVTGCSDEAAAEGVTIGTTLRRALALCPGAVFLPLQEGVITAENAKLIDLLKQHSPAVEVIAPGHAHFDVRGMALMARMEDERWLEELRSAAAARSGLPVRAGGAETVFAAHAAVHFGSDHSDTPIPRYSDTHGEARHANTPTRQYANTYLVPDGGAKHFLARLPVEALPIDPAVHQRLRLFGLERLGDIARLTFSAMQAQFGRQGARAWELANGRDDARIIPGREEVLITEETDLPAPTALSEPLVVATRQLLQRALARPEAGGQPIRRLDWRTGLESGEVVARRFVFREPTNDERRILFVARAKIERLQLPAAAVSVGVTLSGVCSEYGHQANLWPIGPRRWRELEDAVEQLTARVGGPQVFRIVDVQPWSRIPERQLGLVAF